MTLELAYICVGAAVRSLRALNALAASETRPTATERRHEAVKSGNDYAGSLPAYQQRRASPLESGDGARSQDVRESYRLGPRAHR